MGFVMTGAKIAAGACAAGVLGLVAPRVLVSKPLPVPPATAFSAEGRDAALVNLVHQAKRTIYVRTADLNLTPLVNELGQLQQGGVQVTVDLPMDAGREKHGAALSEYLMQTGAVVQFGSSSPFSYEGAYVLVDGSRFLYSASPLAFAPPGAPRSFVVGTLPSHG